MISEIETAIIEKLSDIDGVKSVASAQGSPEDILQETISQRPAIRVIYTGSEHEPPQVINARITEMTLNFLCMVVASKTYKNEAENIYTIIEAIRQRLQRVTIQDYGFLYLVSESLIAIQNGIAVYGCEYQIKTTFY